MRLARGQLALKRAWASGSAQLAHNGVYSLFIGTAHNKCVWLEASSLKKTNVSGSKPARRGSSVPEPRVKRRRELHKRPILEQMRLVRDQLALKWAKRVSGHEPEPPKRTVSEIPFIWMHLNGYWDRFLFMLLFLFLFMFLFQFLFLFIFLFMLLFMFMFLIMSLFQFLLLFLFMFMFILRK